MKPVEKNNINGGIQDIYKFPNGYGASVIEGGTMARGLELAVLEVSENGDTNLCYTTPITDDVLGHLTRDELKETLEAIESLPKR